MNFTSYTCINRRYVDLFNNLQAPQPHPTPPKIIKIPHFNRVKMCFASILKRLKQYVIWIRIGCMVFISYSYTIVHM